MKHKPLTIYCRKGLHVLDVVKEISEETGIEMEYRNRNPDGDECHYVVYKPTENFPWTHDYLHYFDDAGSLLTDLLSWQTLIRCMKEVRHCRNRSRKWTDEPYGPLLQNREAK